jgi:SprT protein
MKTVGLKTVTAELKSRVNAKVAECIAKVNARYGINMRPVNIEYDIHSARLGGQAIHHTRTLRFNPGFLTLHTEKYLATTVPHELAHIAVYDKWQAPFVTGGFRRERPTPHGSEWQSMMVVVGAPVKRCHTYTVPEGVVLGKAHAKFHYKCQNCGNDHFVGAKVHAKILRGAKYHHTTCGKGGQLVPATTTIIVQPKLHTMLGIIPKTPVPVQKSQTKDHAGMSKFDRCLAIYMSHPGKSRKAIISKFVDEVEMTAAGASTYYSKCTKEAAK